MANIRNRLIQYINDKGVKQSHIARALRVPESLLSDFKRDRKDLWPETLAKLDAFLKAEGY